MTLKPSIQRLRESFIARITITMMAAMILFAVFFSWHMARIQRKVYEENMSRGGRTVVAMLAQNVQLAVFAENEEDCAMPVDALFIDNEILEAQVFTAQGNLLYKKQRNPGGVTRLRENPEQLAVVFQETRKTGFWQVNGEDIVLFWSPVKLSATGAVHDIFHLQEGETPPVSEIVGYVAVAASKEKFNRDLGRIYFAISIAFFFFLAAGLASVLLVVRRMSQPLDSLLKKLRERTNDATDDLSLLTSSYGAMVGDLESAFVEINTLKEGLEDKVAIRTRELFQANKELLAGKHELEQILDELRLTQSQLLQQEKMAAIGSLVAGIAHEMNNSVNFISGAVPSLKRCLAELQKLPENSNGNNDDPSDSDPEELYRLINGLTNNIEEGARRLARIISDLKLFSRKESETPMEIDIHPIIDSSLKLANGGDHGQVEIVRNYGEIAPLCCLPGRLSQVFVNISTNAIQAMEGRGTLTVYTRQDEKEVHVGFRDTGDGIDAAILPRIFEPFYTTKTIGKGTGLGLGISYAIVRQHGGDIRVESKKGIGTVFDVVLPRIKLLHAKQGSCKNSVFQ
ncbi:MAG: ATP-binding protein [Pseudomonadota bacterium]